MDSLNIKIKRINQKNFLEYCESCDYKTTKPSDWKKHLICAKHLRNGQQKTTKCDKCNYETNEHWILKRHILTQHGTLEEKQQQKYYCNICDYVFFTKLYLDKHSEGKYHKLKVESLS